MFIGNNHLHDSADGIRCTLLALAERGLVSSGAGSSAEEAARSMDVLSGNRVYRLLGFGWPVIGCQTAGDRRPGVNPLE